MQSLSPTKPSRFTLPGMGCLQLDTSWGPFSSTFLGISHILDHARGTMADVSLYVARTQPHAVVLPTNTFDYVPVMDGLRRATIRAIPEDVAADYSGFTLRYLIDPHGDCAIARFTTDQDQRMHCDITFENASDQTREYSFGLGIFAMDAQRKIRLRREYIPWWMGARHYSHIEAYRKSFGLGCRQCLNRTSNWSVEEQVLAQAFGCWSGDKIQYNITTPKPLENGFIYFRYIKYGDVNPEWELKINGKTSRFRFLQTWVIPGGGWGKNRDAYEEWQLLRVPVGYINDRSITLELNPIDPPGNDRSQIWLDGMLLSDGLLAGDDGVAQLLPVMLIDDAPLQTVRVQTKKSDTAKPVFQFVNPDQSTHDILITADNCTMHSRDGRGSYLANLRQRMGLPAMKVERDSMVSPWGAVDSSPISVPARSIKTIHVTMTFECGGNGKVPVNHKTNHSPAPMPAAALGPFCSMISHLRDLLVFNVNYPIGISGHPSAYPVPAKFFPIPYSWDGGFTAMGMATFAPELAMQHTAFFFAEPKDKVPLLYCGSPVPTPMYALWDIYQTTQDVSCLFRTYAGAKRLYDFYLGRTDGSIANEHNDGFLSTYAYYYNYGIDDHPVQLWAEEKKITHKGFYSIILMAQMARIARMMRNIATLIDKHQDAQQYGRDTELLTNNIDGYMWDEPSGLYGWLCRMENGLVRPTVGGLQGDQAATTFLPLFAGITTHKNRLFEALLDPARFRTPYGISSVDMKAPFYKTHGYWNGGIWPALQWYIWRGLLEAGEPVLAREIAMTILQSWQGSFTNEYYLGEHFNIKEARMNGVPNFGGLSGVLLPMHAAYFTPYTITSFYDVMLMSQSIDRKNDVMKFSFAAPYLSTPTHDLLINMGRGNTAYNVIQNKQVLCQVKSDEYGHFAIRLKSPVKVEEIEIAPAALA